MATLDKNPLPEPQLGPWGTKRAEGLLLCKIRHKHAPNTTLQTQTTKVGIWVVCHFGGAKPRKVAQQPGTKTREIGGKTVTKVKFARKTEKQGLDIKLDNPQRNYQTIENRAKTRKVGEKPVPKMIKMK